MKLSIIIPTRSRYPNLVHVVEALSDQTVSKEDYEVIVSDDNSTDETQSIINQFKDRLNLKYVFSNIPKPHTWNASVVRNLGAMCADQSSIAYLFVDSDVVLPRHAIEMYIKDLEENKDRVIIGSYDFYREGNETVAQADVRTPKFDSSTPQDTYDTVHDGLACFGGNICMPKDIFWKVGGFSPDTHIGLEDGDMGLKLWKTQTKFSYDNRVKGKHLWHQTPTDRFPTNMKEHIDNLNLKHFHTKDPDYGIVEASRDTYSSWGIIGWNPPKEWLANQLDMTLKMQ